MKILNFGSLNIDKVYQMREFVSAGETVAAIDLNTFAGGKGMNQSIAIARAGAEVIHVGNIGPDGLFLKEMLADAGANVSQIEVLDADTGHAIIQVNENGQNCIIIYGGANQMFTKAHIDKALALGDVGDIVLLQNEINDIEYIIDAAHERGLTVALNPSPIDDHLLCMDLSKVGIFILNEIEGAALAGDGANAGDDEMISAGGGAVNEAMAVENKIDYPAILKALSDKYPNAKIVLTLGSEGVLYRDKDITSTHGIYKVKAVDTTAAGDTFAGYFLAALCACCEPGETNGDCNRIRKREALVGRALELASAAAAIAVTRHGASPSIPVMAEVEELLSEEESSSQTVKRQD